VLMQLATGGIASLPFPVQPVVQVVDAAGNDVTGPSGTGLSINVGIAHGPAGGGFVSGSTYVTTSDTGTATFEGLSLSTAGMYTLVFGGLPLGPVRQDITIT